MRKPETVEIRVDIEFSEKEGFFHSHLTINDVSKECMAISSVRSLDAHKCASAYVEALNQLNVEFAGLFFKGVFTADEPERPATTHFGHGDN